MNTHPDTNSIPAPAPPPAPRRFKKRWILFGLLGAFAVLVAAVLWSFRVSGEARAVRSALLDASRDRFEQKFAFGVGWPVLGATRVVSSFTRLDEDAKTALQALRRADVSIHELSDDAVKTPRQDLLAAADRAMERRGWERVVGVLEDDQVVGIYVPRDGTSSDDLRLSLFVLDGRELVIVSTRCNLEPLLEIAERHGGLKGKGLLGLAR